MRTNDGEPDPVDEVQQLPVGEELFMAKWLGRIKGVEKAGIGAVTHAIRPFADPVIKGIAAGGVEKEPPPRLYDIVGVLQSFHGEVDVLKNIPKGDNIKKIGVTLLPIACIDGLVVQLQTEFAPGKLAEDSLRFNPLNNRPGFRQQMGEESGTGADVEAVHPGQSDMALDKEEIFSQLLFAGRKPALDVVPRLAVEGWGCRRQAVEVIDVMKVAGGASINRGLFQQVFRAGSGGAAQFAADEIIVRSGRPLVLINLLFQRHLTSPFPPNLHRSDEITGAFAIPVQNNAPALYRVRRSSRPWHREKHPRKGRKV